MKFHLLSKVSTLSPGPMPSSQPSTSVTQACLKLLSWLIQIHLLLVMDASNTAMGAILQQRVNDVWQPLAFFSRMLSPAWKNTVHIQGTASDL
jgi:hypothetical protein